MPFLFLNKYCNASILCVGDDKWVIMGHYWVHKHLLLFRPFYQTYQTFQLQLIAEVHSALYGTESSRKGECNNFEIYE